MGDNDFESELRKIREELNRAERQNEPEQVRDIDEILKEHKKKLIVKTKNHMYLSINDVFEQREVE
jgi:hypothetical protein